MMRAENPALVTDMISNFLQAKIYTNKKANFYKLNSLPYDCPNSVRINFNNSVANGYWDILKLNDDTLVYIVDNEYTSSFIYPYISQKDHMVFRFVLTGDMVIDSNRKQNIVLHGPSVNYFSSPKLVENKITYRKGSRHKMVTLYISRKKIRKLLSPVTDKKNSTLHKLFNTDGLGGCNLALIPEIHGIIIEIFKNQFFGPLRQVFVTSKVNELLCYTLKYIGSISNDCQDSTISTKDQAKIRNVFEILNNQYIAPPPIDLIARKAGLNRTDLRKYFKIIHGQTIFDFCMNKRMIEAKSKLLFSEMSITQLGLHLGYNHPANFTMAFKKFYGVSPKKLQISGHK